ncbi:MAG: extensin family protein [Polyangiaceae bacterium]
MQPIDAGAADADPAAADAGAVIDEAAARAALDAQPYRQPSLPPALGAAPATRYARLDARKCKAELAARGIAFREVHGGPRGVAVPVRLTAPLRGVRVVAPGGKGNHDVLDCRLALALDDAAEAMARQQVSSVRIDSFHRRGARLPGRRKPSQHALGLAADVMSFTLLDGRTVSIAADWQGGRGEPACGPQAGPLAPSTETIAVRNIVCALAAEGMFHRVLTPGYDAAHESHLHLDIARDARAMSVR